MRHFVLCAVLNVFPLTLAAASAASEPKASARAASSEEIAMLNQVLLKTADDLRRWAYTEHRVIREPNGKVKSDVLLRHDPSKPYAEQWTPLKIDGKEPSERERAKYRKRGEQSAPRGTQATGSAGSGSRSSRRVTLGEVLDVPRASIAAETSTHWIFEIPLLKVGNQRFPPEKFQVHARIRKHERLLENIAVKLRDLFRSKLVVKVKSGEGSIDFAAVDPKYPPTMVRITGDASASILLVSIGGSVVLERKDLKHVKPFDERFEVQIGNLKAIDF